MVVARRYRASAHIWVVLFWVGFISGRAASAQATTQFWPEVSTFVRLNPNLRFYFLATTTQEDGVRTGAEFGPNLDFYFKPLVKLQRLEQGDPDQAKKRLLTFRIGYRYLPSPDTPAENRGVLEATPRFPFSLGLLFSDRNRIDLRGMEGKFSWRYRNRMMIERETAIHQYHFAPYVRSEVFYDSNPEKWSRTTVSAGAAFPTWKRFEMEPYFEHMNDTGGPSNRQVNAIGLAANLFF